MALTERNRNALYQGLTRTIGDEEAVEAMLSQFPSRQVDEPATKDFVSDLVRAELVAMERRIEAKMDDRFATKDFVTAVEHRLSARIIESASEVKEHVHQEMRHYVLWSYGAIFLLVTGVLAVAKILQ